MRIVHSIADLQLDRSKSIGFVPTMGAFHEGHLSLMRTAKAQNDRCIVSLFVNPTQFGRGEDFDKYPRDLDRDAAMAEQAGVDVIFAPDVGEMYPRASTTLHVPEITERWEGSYRPTHFDGVATVVAKLLLIVRPDLAYFGLKDLQQCLVIQRMVEDLHLPVGLKLEETIRESDGLAMSSRNVYLSREHRELAPSLYRELCALKSLAIELSGNIDQALVDARRKLTQSGFHVDYLELVELNAMEATQGISQGAAIIVAAKLGNTRLIDNVRIS